jgi:N-acetylmuramoyl-L-alanine amidase
MIPPTLAPNFTPTQIMLATVVGEAEGEAPIGQLAVAQVIWNRADHDLDRVKAVCLKPAQFSCWSRGSPRKRAMEKIMKDPMSQPLILSIVKAVIDEKIPDLLHGAQFYFNPQLIFPAWAKDMRHVVTVGNHAFYRQA